MVPSILLVNRRQRPGAYEFPQRVCEAPGIDTSTAPAPVLDLTGYTQVAPSNVTFLPAAGSTLTINGTANITATSSAKTITEVLLLQTVTDPTDTVLLYATQSPFTIPFTPTRLGSTSFGAIAVFSDNTYAMTTLNYTFQPGDTPYALNLVNAPVASMNVGDSRVVQANALSPSGPINVTQVATYTARSGSTSVFSVGAGGTITANGNGMDLLDVSYGGVTATAPDPGRPVHLCVEPDEPDRSQHGRHGRDSGHHPIGMRLDGQRRRRVVAIRASQRQRKRFDHAHGVGQ